MKRLLVTSGLLLALGALYLSPAIAQITTNILQLVGTATGTYPILAAKGQSAVIGMNLVTKGGACVQINGVCISAGSAVGPGTVNTVAKFTGVNAVGDSDAVDDGVNFTYTTPLNEYGFIHTNGTTVAVGTFITSTGGWFGTRTDHPLHFFTNDGSTQILLNQDSSVDFAGWDGAVDYALFTVDGADEGSGERGIRLKIVNVGEGWTHENTVAGIIVGTRTLTANGGEGGIGTFTNDRLCLFVNNSDCRAGVTATNENFVVTSGSDIDAVDVVSSIFTVFSTQQGSIPAPRMTTAQRDTGGQPVGTPTEGLMVFNTTTHLPNWYNGTSWQAPAVAGSAVTSLAGTANQITASAATGAVTISLPSAVTMPGSLTVTTRTGMPASFACFDSGGKLVESATVCVGP